jgi:AcrR family transcriptional regulator
MARARTGTSARAAAGRMGRRPGPSTTRHEILAAARESFAKARVRRDLAAAVAATAGVDPALVRRFFGSKERLLIAALSVSYRQDRRLASVVSGNLETLGEEMVGYFLSVWEKPSNRDVVIGMVRSACTNARAARLLRDFLANEVIAHPADAVNDGEEARMRATLVGSQIVGLAMYRYVLKIDPVASASREELPAIYGPVLQRYLRSAAEPALPDPIRP